MFLITEDIIFLIYWTLLKIVYVILLSKSKSEIV